MAKILPKRKSKLKKEISLFGRRYYLYIFDWVEDDIIQKVEPAVTLNIFPDFLVFPDDFIPKLLMNEKTYS